MSFVVSAKGNTDFSPHPAGVFAARCVRFIDLGSQETEWKGQKKLARKIMLGFQTEALIEDGEMAGKPFLVTQRYTASLSDKAILRKDLESWRGRKFTPQELDGFDLRNVLGKACLLNIVHDDKGDKVYANISSIMPLPPSMSAPQPDGDLIEFSMQPGEFDRTVFDKLSDRLKELISKTPEYVEATGSGRSNAQREQLSQRVSQRPVAPPPQTRPQPPSTDAFSDMDDDIPF